MDLLDMISKIPGVEIPPEVRTAVANKEIRDEMNIVLKAAAPLFKEAGQKDTSLKAIFNDVASVLPVASTYLETLNVPKLKGAMVTPAMYRLKKNGDDLANAFNTQDPAVTGIINSLLGNTAVQDALKNILTKPEGQGLFVLEKVGNQGYGVEQLSGTNLKIPLPDDNYNTIKAIVDAAAASKKPQPPKFG